MCFNSSLCFILFLLNTSNSHVFNIFNYVYLIPKLCARKHGREKLRNNGAYIVMRELHKVEENGSVAMAIEKLIHILIGDEPADHMENLKQVEIPEDIKTKFDEIDAKEEVEMGT